jgi:pimeloyl-ACP methyl ester carboxylesterase
MGLVVALLVAGCAANSRVHRSQEPTKMLPGQMLHTTVRGLSIAYAKRGSGPALVLLHGFTQDSRVWRPQLEALSQHFTVIAWDAPGAGQSSDPPESFTIGDWADSLAGVLDAERIDRAHVLGLSWGGLLAQEFYRRHPNRVQSLLLVDTYGGWKGSLPAPVPEQRLAACQHDASLPPAEFVPRYLPGMFSDSPPPAARDELAGIMSATHPAGFVLMAKVLAEGDTRELLPTIRVPTLLLWGDADKRAPIAIANQLRDGIPGARLVVLKGAGHVSNLEQPAEFNRVVREFCSTVGAAR